jgi:hypothetical protein
VSEELHDQLKLQRCRNKRNDHHRGQILLVEKAELNDDKEFARILLSELQMAMKFAQLHNAKRSRNLRPLQLVDSKLK